MDNPTLRLATQGVYRSVQGEGVMLGVPMVFVRLAGCSVGCPLCDTDYRVAERVAIATIVDRVQTVANGVRWAWVTGGEPTDQAVEPLARALYRAGFRPALATSGVRPIDPLDWSFVSVSPHNPDRWAVRSGSELKLIPGLNGFCLTDFDPIPTDVEFAQKYVIPCSDIPGSLAECIEWIDRHPGWRLGIQAHKIWDLA